MSPAILKADITLLIWLAASYAGMAVGGRFYGHYFFQIMPALSLIAARGLIEITSSPLTLRWRGREFAVKRAGIAVLIIGFLFTLARYHGRTAALATDWVRGTKSEMTAEWFHERLKREERLVAAAVRELPDEADQVERLSAEAMREGGPRFRAADGKQDYLFVWGYRPEIYYWSGLLPASRYLSTQPLTGVPADVHYFGEDYRSLLDDAATSRARLELVNDLRQTQPRYIIDELGFFNSELAIEDFPELRDFMAEYKNHGATGRFLIYRRKDAGRKERKATESNQPPD